MRQNDFGQPIGDEVPDWRVREVPPRVVLEGPWVSLEPLTAAHVEELAAAYLPVDPPQWTYVPYDPPLDREEVAELVRAHMDTDWVTSVVRLRSTGRVGGMLSLMRITPVAGSIEIGSVLFGAPLRRTPASTAAQRLLMGHVFEDLGYRRLEWKCDALNAPSMRAAERLGYTYEGTFRQALVYKGRNRDTAWWSITDVEWPAVRARLDAWLHPGNFDERGRQRSSLGA